MSIYGCLYPPSYQFLSELCLYIHCFFSLSNCYTTILLVTNQHLFPSSRINNLFALFCFVLTWNLELSCFTYYSNRITSDLICFFPFLLLDGSFVNLAFSHPLSRFLLFFLFLGYLCSSFSRSSFLVFLTCCNILKQATIVR